MPEEEFAKLDRMFDGFFLPKFFRPSPTTTTTSTRTATATAAAGEAGEEQEEERRYVLKLCTSKVCTRHGWRVTTRDRGITSHTHRWLFDSSWKVCFLLPHTHTHTPWR